MWANTVWGFASLTFTSLLAGLFSTSDPYMKAWLYYLAIIFGACGLFVLVWPMLKRVIDQLSGEPSALDVAASPDMPIAKVIDYIVNDSTQKLKRSSPPRIPDILAQHGIPQGTWLSTEAQMVGDLWRVAITVEGHSTVNLDIGGAVSLIRDLKNIGENELVGKVERALKICRAR